MGLWGSVELTNSGRRELYLTKLGQDEVIPRGQLLEQTDSISDDATRAVVTLSAGARRAFPLRNPDPAHETGEPGSGRSGAVRPVRSCSVRCGRLARPIATRATRAMGRRVPIISRTINNTEFGFYAMKLPQPQRRSSPR